MAKTPFIRVAVSAVFPEWSSTRMAKWLGVNPRTIQRWMTTDDPQISDEEVPADLRAKMRQQAQVIQEIDLGGQIDHFIEMHRKNGVEDEVLAAWIAFKYKQNFGRDIE